MTRRKVRNIVLVVIGVPCSILFILLAFADWAWGGRVQTSLDAQYVPTAEALLQNPAGIPSFLRDIHPSPGSIIEAGQGICANVDVRRLSLSSRDIADWTRFYINGSRAPWSGVSLLGELSSAGTMEIAQFCTVPKLERGLHLIEIRVGTSIAALFNPAEARSYTWAYRVE